LHLFEVVRGWAEQEVAARGSKSCANTAHFAWAVLQSTESLHW